jgi:hypothetical protein
MFNTFSDTEIRQFHDAYKACLLNGGARITKVQAGNVGSEKEYQVDFGNPTIASAICREFEKRFAVDGVDNPIRPANRRTTVCFG